MKTAFIDRDGVLIYEPLDTQQIDSLEKLKILPGVIAGLLNLKQAGYSLVMISNQNGAGTPNFPTEDFEAPQQALLAQLKTAGIKFEEIFICKHLPSDNCPCRKPKTGLVDTFITQVDRKNSIMIGDRESDMEFARNIGVRGIKVQTNTLFPRFAYIKRETTETQIELELNLDGTGEYEIKTPIGFFNHMLELFSKHSLIDLRITAIGDTDKDDHHTIEDVGIALGQAIAKAVGTKQGICRYGAQTLPMDEVLCLSAVDLSGRFSFETNYEAKREMVNDFPTEMLFHFFQSIAINAMMNIHIQFLNSGKNEHHRLEAAFKSFGRALRQATEYDPRTRNSLPSTKGTL